MPIDMGVTMGSLKLIPILNAQVVSYEDKYKNNEQDQMFDVR